MSEGVFVVSEGVFVVYFRKVVMSQERLTV